MRRHRLPCLFCGRRPRALFRNPKFSPSDHHSNVDDRDAHAITGNARANDNTITIANTEPNANARTVAHTIHS